MCLAHLSFLGCPEIMGHVPNLWALFRDVQGVNFRANQLRTVLISGRSVAFGYRQTYHASKALASRLSGDSVLPVVRRRFHSASIRARAVGRPALIRLLQLRRRRAQECVRRQRCNTYVCAQVVFVVLPGGCLHNEVAEIDRGRQKRDRTVGQFPHRLAPGRRGRGGWERAVSAQHQAPARVGGQLQTKPLEHRRQTAFAQQRRLSRSAGLPPCDHHTFRYAAKRAITSKVPVFPLSASTLLAVS